MLLVVLVCGACALYWIWRHQPGQSTEPYGYPGGGLPLKDRVLLLLGHTQTLWNVVNTLARQSYLLGGVMTARVGFRSFYVLTDPDMFKVVADNCASRHDDSRVPNGNYLALYRLLSPSYLNNFVTVFNSQARKLVTQLRHELGCSAFDPTHYVRLHALESVCLTSLGEDYTGMLTANNDSRESVAGKVMDLLMNCWLDPSSVRNYDVKRRHNALLANLDSLTDIFLYTSKSNRNYGIDADSNLKTGSLFPSLLSLLSEVTMDRMVVNEKEPNQMEEMIEHGSRTMAAALVFALVLLGSHPEVQEKVVTELVEILGDGSKDVDKEQLSKLIFLEAVIKESMRLYSVVPVIARQLDREVQLEKYTLSAGRACYFIANPHQQPLVWGPTVREFRPERWLQRNNSSEADACVFFGVRGQMCLGKTYTFMWMKTTLAQLLRQYKVVADHSQMALALADTLRPAAGHHISIESRYKSH